MVAVAKVATASWCRPFWRRWGGETLDVVLQGLGAVGVGEQFALTVFSALDGVPVVLDGVFSPSGQSLGYLGPSVPNLLV